MNKLLNEPIVASIAMLILGAFTLPEGYYVLLRIIIFLSSGYLSAFSFYNQKKKWGWCFAFCAILFNPFFLIYFDKLIWIGIDLITAFFMLMFLWVLDKKQNKWAAYSSLFLFVIMTFILGFYGLRYVPVFWDMFGETPKEQVCILYRESVLTGDKELRKWANELANEEGVDKIAVSKKVKKEIKEQIVALMMDYSMNHNKNSLNMAKKMIKNLSDSFSQEILDAVEEKIGSNPNNAHELK